MLDRIEKMARLSVSRACGFAGLATLTFFVGMSHNLPLALKLAGILALITCLVLLIKAQCATAKPYKHTELWLLLKPDERPQPAIAQQIIGTVMRETFLQYAMHSGVCSAGCFVMSLLLGAYR